MFTVRHEPTQMFRVRRDAPGRVGGRTPLYLSLVPGEIAPLLGLRVSYFGQLLDDRSRGNLLRRLSSLVSLMFFLRRAHRTLFETIRGWAPCLRNLQCGCDKRSSRGPKYPRIV